MTPDLQEALRETLKLTRENNQILHSMRRNAFFWGFVKFLIYAVIFIAPIWFYMNYISADVDNLINALNKADGAAVSTQAQFSGFAAAMQSFEASLPSWLHPWSSATTTK